MTRLRQLLRQPEFHIFLCCLLFILINWPFLSIYAKKGLMSLFVYLFVLWALFIVLLFIVHGILTRPDSDESGDEDRGG